MSSVPTHPQIAAGDHRAYMDYAITQAQHSPPKPTNFCVGAVLVDADRNSILATGFTLELEGNTHAEQCCFMKVAEKHHVCEEDVATVLPANVILYTTMEPCNKRSAENMTCVERILRCGKGIKKVYAGVLEPEKFVGENVGRKRLVESGIPIEIVEGFGAKILDVATAGHTGKGKD